MTKFVGKKKSPLPHTWKDAIINRRDKRPSTTTIYAEHAEHLLPHAEHAEHAPLRWKTLDTFHPRERGIPSDGSSLMFIHGLSPPGG